SLSLRTRIARVQRRQLDGDAGTGDRAATARRTADGVDCMLVGTGIARGVGSGHRGFAQHVERERVAALFALAPVVDGFLNRAARDELPAEEAHREIHT